jgi:transposase
MLLTMKDTQRVEAIQAVMDTRITVVEAARVLGLCPRQVWRLQAGMRTRGIEAVIHGNRGRQPWNRSDDEMWKEILTLIRERYTDINDLHLIEILEREHQVVVRRESLRQRLRGAGLGPKQKRRPRKCRSRRERKPAAGMMLQIDASPHDWLEGRGPRLTLVGAKDDATSFGWHRFVPAETTWAYLSLMREIFLSAGLPLSLYSDRHDIFHSPRTPTIIEQLNDERPLTQFGRAMDTLGITIIPAYSPQAKGRIERQWGVFQDRLVVELRLAGATTIDQANSVLDRMMKHYNHKFTISPSDPEAVWRHAPCAFDLDRILCLKEQRVVALDHTVRFENLILQIPRPKAAPSIVNQHVAVLQLRDGSIEIHHHLHRVARFTKNELSALIRKQLPKKPHQDRHVASLNLQTLKSNRPIANKEKSGGDSCLPPLGGREGGLSLAQKANTLG